MLILQEQYFHSSKTFLKVRTRQWENGLSKMYQDFWVFFGLPVRLFLIGPSPAWQLSISYETYGLYMSFLRFTFRSVNIYAHIYAQSVMNKVSK